MPHPRVVLGIADNHDAGACLVAEGQVQAAVSEERLDRIKNSGAFPSRAIQSVLDLAGIQAKEIDCIAVGTAFTPAAPLRLLRKWHHRLKDDASQFSSLLNLYILYQVALKRLGLTRLETLASTPILKRDLARSGIRAELRFIDHHYAHAASAALTAPFDPALVFTLDAMGDGTSVTVHLSREGKLEPLFRQSGRAAINTYYSRVTEYLGFRPLRHEGKITGLAAYTEAPPALVEHFSRQLRFVSPGFSTTDYVRPSRMDDPEYAELGRYTRDEIAAALQRNLEQQVRAFVAHWVEHTGVGDIALAGGAFANVKLNQRLHQLEGVRSIHVYPHMSDGGLPAGAAMLVAGMTPAPMPSPYLGPDISESEARAALQEAGLPFRCPADMARVVAAKLQAGEVVARAAGRLEWGPRALGNRSLLYRPDDPSVNDWLNKRLRRTEFMPFAPSTLFDDAALCYECIEGAENTARFMTTCFNCTPQMTRSCPGVVHVDGTARPQLVRQGDSPDYFDIIKQFKALTGISSIINTSFNMHEEPIVGSARDAVRAYLEADLDTLVLGPFLVNGGENTRKEGRRRRR